jgi:hypothetical protein
MSSEAGSLENEDIEGNPTINRSSLGVPFFLLSGLLAHMALPTPRSELYEMVLVGLAQGPQGLI